MPRIWFQLKRSEETSMDEALLVIDMQKQFHKGTAGFLMDNVAPKITDLVRLCRENQVPVIWIKHSNKRIGLIEGNESFEYIDSIKPDDKESKITKTYGNGFKKTDLYRILKEKGVNKVYLCGFAAEGCVHNTYKGAKELKYDAWKIEDAIASNSNLLLKMFSKIGKRTTISGIEKSLV